MFYVIKNINNYSTTDFSDMLLNLPLTEQERISYINNGLRKKQSILAYNTLFFVLSKKFGINNPVIVRDKNGKPFIEHNVYFSVSHSKDFVALAFSENKIGIDIEKIRPIKRGVMFKYNLDLKTWTIKEAIIKAKGLTLKEINNIKPNCENQNIFTTKCKNYYISICELK
ncbi:MAG: hypothetical protein IJP26_06090 [Clostridia bacterium]|nr:hypothetical protein [Clostridia bacterium]